MYKPNNAPSHNTPGQIILIAVLIALIIAACATLWYRVHHSGKCWTNSTQTVQQSK